MNKNSKIFIAGHRGLVGSAIVRKLQTDGYKKLLLKTRQELDLTDKTVVENFFKKEKPELVVLAAAKVGGIKANMTYPSEFLYENLQIQDNVIWSAHQNGVKKLLFLGSSCIFPRNSAQPMKEEYFLEGRPEPTNEAYAIAKIAGLKFCEYIYEEFSKQFVSCMPTNIYGPGDNFDFESSHVIPALMRRMHEAKLNKTPEVVVWGTGNTRREFLHCDDLADAVLFLLQNYKNKQFINVGTGEDISIKELAHLIKEVVGYKGNLVFDSTKPDGFPRKLLDVSRIHKLGWHHKIPFEKGLKDTYSWYTAQTK
ncbi:MAG TPA: GDP-L-fucose synthase [Candidatus Saccharimonadales bacterium]|nr:GDP-L-fucose synthase [Candidatus Saccharimonadales bacterium]